MEKIKFPTHTEFSDDEREAEAWGARIAREAKEFLQQRKRQQGTQTEGGVPVERREIKRGNGK